MTSTYQVTIPKKNNRHNGTTIDVNINGRPFDVSVGVPIEVDESVYDVLVNAGLVPAGLTPIEELVLDAEPAPVETPTDIEPISAPVTPQGDEAPLE